MSSSGLEKADDDDEWSMRKYISDFCSVNKKIYIVVIVPYSHKLLAE